MNKVKPISLRLTPENKERMRLISEYFNSDRYPVEGSISANFAINFCIETFYNLFVETDPNITPKRYHEAINDYIRVRDNEDNDVMRKLNRIDQMISQDKYINMGIFKSLVIDPESKMQDIKSIYLSDSFESKFEQFLSNQVKSDRNYNYNMKHRLRRRE